MMEVQKVYFRLLQTEPYDHQQKAWEAIKGGRLVILRVPTGSGKTEAVFLPFMRFAGDGLPTRLIYTLPLRSLAEQIQQRLGKYACRMNRLNWRVRLQHGQRPESVLFAADVIVATIDQVITSYACTPLTLPVRHGNIPAGAVMSSFLVFDEVHLFDPQLALQAMRLICERLSQLGLPFAVLSATLPDAVVEFWCEHFGCEVIEAAQEPYQRNVRMEWKGEQLADESIRNALQRFSRIVRSGQTLCRGKGLRVSTSTFTLPSRRPIGEGEMDQ